MDDDDSCARMYWRRYMDDDGGDGDDDGDEHDVGVRISVGGMCARPISAPFAQESTRQDYSLA